MQRDQGQSAAGRVAGNDDVAWIDTLRKQPSIGPMAIVWRCREAMLGGEAVIDHERTRA